MSSSASRESQRDVADVRRRLRAWADPRAARLLRRATRSPWSVYGVIPPRLRALSRGLARKHSSKRDLPRLLATARALWRSPWHEEKTVAVQVLASQVRRLGPEHWSEFKAWVGTVKTVDHADAIAVDLLGSLVKRDRSWCRVLKHWTLSENAWERRAAVMGVLSRVHQMGDVEAGYSMIESLMRDRSPRVQEAVSLLIEEAYVSDPAQTRAFLDRWRPKASPSLLRRLTLR